MNDLWPKDEVAVADEKTTLLAFLGHQRTFLVRKTAGLTDDQHVGRGAGAMHQPCVTLFTSIFLTVDPS